MLHRVPMSALLVRGSRMNFRSLYMSYLTGLKLARQLTLTPQNIVLVAQVV